MKVFLAIAAIFAWIFALAMLFAPAKFYAPAGFELTPMLATLDQAHVATLFGLGVINWGAREAKGRGLTAVLFGNLMVQVLSLIVVIRTMRLGAGTAVAPGIVIHVVLGGFFLFFLLRAKKEESVRAAA